MNQIHYTGRLELVIVGAVIWIVLAIIASRRND